MTRHWGRTEATFGAVVAVLFITLTPGLPIWASYLLFWAPLVVAVVVAARRGRASPDGGIGRIAFRVTWTDALVGAFVGLLLRCAMIAIELLTAGSVTSSSSMFEADHNLLWFATAIIAPAIIAPVVEELFFRGLILPAIGTNWIGILGSAIIFSAMHLAYGFDVLTAISTFIVGVAFGILAVRSKRLGAGITAHVVYNASLIAISELGGLTPIGS